MNKITAHGDWNLCRFGGYTDVDPGDEAASGEETGGEISIKSRHPVVVQPMFRRDAAKGV